MRHFDLYSQALSKIEDLLHRYPAIDPAAFRAKVARALT